MSVSKEEVRELWKNESNFGVFYEERAVDLIFEGYCLDGFFDDIVRDLTDSYGFRVDLEILDLYFDGLELGRKACQEFRDWISEKGGYEKDGCLVLPQV
ncbi:hypothetical protein [Methanonatronarchaeum sp. AMET-Sl]|uniref:hypothetical protein n=1 Tax=Methanonatronarchaeum sp. AMET-Sl TaxID=3037654 RepID=UPI00244E030C|nr:hypothetical protein [Methanonatronarchaeum sp. AMET-Sl]WGI17863.1 hypothetical protein QEN48_02335 [Methanonatronarchaeum sp. AMET-Sl]